MYTDEINERRLCDFSAFALTTEKLLFKPRFDKAVIEDEVFFFLYSCNKILKLLASGRSMIVCEFFSYELNSSFAWVQEEAQLITSSFRKK